jgi:hypothetical protein
LTTSLSSGLTNSLNFYIYFLTASAFLYLVNLSYISNYSYFRQGFFVSLLPFLIFLVWL